MKFAVHIASSSVNVMNAKATYDTEMKKIVVHIGTRISKAFLEKNANAGFYDSHLRLRARLLETRLIDTNYSVIKDFQVSVSNFYALIVGKWSFDPKSKIFDDEGIPIKSFE